MTILGLHSTMATDPLQLSIEGAPIISTKEVDEGFPEVKIACRSNIPDLPIELWIEVLSYLPPGSVRKVIGLNRYLFERGMDEIYEEVQMVANDGAGLKTFEQLR